MTPHDLEVIRTRLMALFQLTIKPSVNMLGTDNQPGTRCPGSKPLVPDSYSAGVILDIKALPQAPWLLFVYHPQTRQCPEEIAVDLLVKAVENVSCFRRSRQECLANLAMVAAMDVRQELLGAPRCTVQMVCDLAGIYLHNWQRDYRDHFNALKKAALELDAKALLAADAIFSGRKQPKNFTALDIQGGVY